MEAEFSPDLKSFKLQTCSRRDRRFQPLPQLFIASNLGLPVMKSVADGAYAESSRPRQAFLAEASSECGVTVCAAGDPERDPLLVPRSEAAAVPSGIAQVNLSDWPQPRHFDGTSPSELPQFAASKLTGDVTLRRIRRFYSSTSLEAACRYFLPAGNA